MNRRERRTRKPTRVCEVEVTFTDFDGSLASAPCGWRATRVVTLFTQQGWLLGAPRTADTFRACTKHANEAHSTKRDYGVEAVISRPL